VVQVKNDTVLRVVPLENEAINECWLSDKDRFSYEGLNSEDRLTKPAIKQGGQWIETDWQTALEFVSHALTDIKRNHGAAAIGMLGTHHSTVEELFLLQKLARGFGVENVDTRLRMSDFELDTKRAGVPWLGMPIADASRLQRALVVGSFLRKDHPLLSSRLRQATKRGLKLNVLHAVDDDLLMPVAGKIITPPSGWHAALNEIAVAVAQAKGEAAPEGLGEVQAGDAATQIAKSLMTGERKAVWLGNAVLQHPQASKLAATAQWIAQATGAVFGVLTEAANTVGAYLVGAVAQGGDNAAQQFATPRKAYVLLNAEPDLDAHNTLAARTALHQAELVVSMTAFKSQVSEYASVLLPITPFTETAGTFVSAEGRVQSFTAVVKPRGDARPGWKVLRVLGNLLGVPGFDFETAEAVRAQALPGDVSARLNNEVSIAPTAAQASSGLALERIAPVPIYSADALVRRAPSLQKTADARTPQAVAHPSVLERLGIKAGDSVRVRQGAATITLLAAVDSGLPTHVVRIAAGHAATASLGAMFGEVTLERV
jgi:NADH-quinone oxidoreductase subunit G